ncbi:MAG: bifunctional (p)ppGpp synthetase/guanosine-3',5'-bis(diphosphate) 3'-pyrophosphohydrolase [Legionellaceae bacterium]|nr:bifunctional (p)ppGpp synthetase/guanosine-3',5'-bis(diphosphate) 3'-pyrophosphohydrolase [Legionellaceae bacterium]
MVKVKDNISHLSDGTIDVEAWLTQLADKGYEPYIPKIRHACTLAQFTEPMHAFVEFDMFQQGLAIADVLADLQLDHITLMAAIVLECVHHGELSLDDVEEQLGIVVARLVSGVQKMSSVQYFDAQPLYSKSKQQVDNVRKMLIAMVDDVRVVLIKLAERLCVLRFGGHLPKDTQENIAKEIFDVYAPLANRLGVGGIKWEMEDLAFRFLETETYKAIAKGLKNKRLERDVYVSQVVHVLEETLRAHGILHAKVYGRSKHIHSIYRKMTRKNVPLEGIYDATALRVLVDTVENCYIVLSLVHQLWQQIPSEFDDYINHPKENGYQSLHTAVIGPEEKVFEVQIRTYHMHECAEKGVAAHWQYKEGVTSPAESHARKIEWLREVLAWHKEMLDSTSLSDTISREYLDDRVYIFTPKGDVLDLPRGVTPLDAAYHIHSQVGHRCRGAKVNGNIMPLTTILKTGDNIEILTGKEEKPSRDWINPNLHYLKTARAKAKVLHWFKQQDFDKNKEEGQELLEKHLKMWGMKSAEIQPILEGFSFKNLEELYAAIGRGDIKMTQIAARILPVQAMPSIVSSFITKSKQDNILAHDLRIEGVGNLLTTMAKCCQPLPGDPVIGYITLGRGVSIHKKDCSNILHATEKQQKRLLQVQWGSADKTRYPIELLIRAYDRQDLLKDMTALFAQEKIVIRALQSQLKADNILLEIYMTIEIENVLGLSKLLNRLEQIPNVLEARRLTSGEKT